MFNAKAVASFIVLYGYSILSVAQDDIVLKSHEQWWEKNLPVFVNWAEDYTVASRAEPRNYIQRMGYKSVLDVGCGLCIDFMGYVKNKIAIEYQGLEISQVLVDKANRMGISVKRGSIEDIPYADNSFDVCYARHMLEHLDYYKKAISEMVRVARNEVLIVFFIKPTYEPDRIASEIDRDCMLYYNHYNKLGIEKFIKSLAKVKKFELWEDADGRWQDLGGQGVMLHIYLNTPQ